MEWQYLITGREELVDRTIAFFTAKVANPDLFQDIIEKCKNNDFLSKKENHATFRELGYLSLNDFIHYESHYFPEKGIPTTIVEVILQKLCEKLILFRSQKFQTINNAVYKLNDSLAEFLTSRGLLKNVVFGFNFIAQNYQKSVVKIVVKTNKGNDAIGTGFLFKVGKDNKVLNVIITNEHVAKYKDELKVIDLDNNVIKWKEIIISEKIDLAAIILQQDLPVPMIHIYSDAKILDEIITIGYPAVPMTSDSFQLVHKGEINSFATDYWNNKYLLFSAKTSPGNSGGPLINNIGMVVGVVTQEFFEQESFQNKGQLPYYAAIPSESILDFLNTQVVQLLN